MQYRYVHDGCTKHFQLCSVTNFHCINTDFFLQRTFLFLVLCCVQLVSSCISREFCYKTENLVSGSGKIYSCPQQAIKCIVQILSFHCTSESKFDCLGFIVNLLQPLLCSSWEIFFSLLLLLLLTHLLPHPVKVPLSRMIISSSQSLFTDGRNTNISLGSIVCLVVIPLPYFVFSLNM
jgi:hypothetical protein